MTNPTKARQQAKRNERLQGALRANLRRRKAQARGRAAEQETRREDADRADDPATAGEEKDG
jgi:hypothetical protein